MIVASMTTVAPWLSHRFVTAHIGGCQATKRRRGPSRRLPKASSCRTNRRTGECDGRGSDPPDVQSVPDKLSLKMVILELDGRNSVIRRLCWRNEVNPMLQPGDTADVSRPPHVPLGRPPRSFALRSTRRPRRPARPAAGSRRTTASAGRRASPGTSAAPATPRPCGASSGPGHPCRERSTSAGAAGRGLGRPVRRLRPRAGRVRRRRRPALRGVLWSGGRGRAGGCGGAASYWLRRLKDAGALLSRSAGHLPRRPHPLEQRAGRLVVPALAPGEFGLRRHEFAAERLREDGLRQRLDPLEGCGSRDVRFIAREERRRSSSPKSGRTGRTAKRTGGWKRLKREHRDVPVLLLPGWKSGLQVSRAADTGGRTIADDRFRIALTPYPPSGTRISKGAIRILIMRLRHTGAS